MLSEGHPPGLKRKKSKIVSFVTPEILHLKPQGQKILPNAVVYLELFDELPKHGT